jgi:hypothetical protein
MYLPFAQNPSRIMHLLVRTQGPPLEWAAAVRRAILGVDRDEPVFDVKTLDGITEQSFSRQSAFGAMLGAAAGLVLLLAPTGIHALLAWSVSRRTREIGIRMAIGAARSDVARMVLSQALQPALAVRCGRHRRGGGAWRHSKDTSGWRGSLRSDRNCRLSGDSDAGGHRCHPCPFVPGRSSGSYYRAADGVTGRFSASTNFTLSISRRAIRCGDLNSPPSDIGG